MMTVVVVVPCYNEAARLDPARFIEFSERYPDVGFLFVDDGSTDQTLEVLEGLKARDEKRFRVLGLTRNMGKAEAVRQGMLRVLTGEEAPGPVDGTDTPAPAEETSATEVAFLDADLATPLDEIPRFHRVLEENPGIDMVFGSRVQLLGRTIHRKLHRHYFARALATAVSLTLDMPIYDSQCGAKLFRPTPELRLALSRPFFSGWLFDVELLARLKRAYADAGRSLEEAIYELPLNHWQEIHGSKTRPRDAITALYNLARIQATYTPRRIRPRRQDT